FKDQSHSRSSSRIERTTGTSLPGSRGGMPGAKRRTGLHVRFKGLSGLPAGKGIPLARCGERGNGNHPVTLVRTKNQCL
ncbi:MAG: hypothetical protein PHD43_21075, partial [Methylococcales bacterium]|nr:hypothetical protein [Methylococcales bacterium]